MATDIETTGLDPDRDQILEIGAIIDDLMDRKPIEELPRFHTYINQDVLVGTPGAISMNAEIIRRISVQEAPYTYTDPDEAAGKLADWLDDNGFNTTDAKVTAAGKNFGGFDRLFLEQLLDLKDMIRFHHRSIDPTIFYWRPGDAELPDTKICMERAGIEGEVAHDALADSEVIIKLIRIGIPQ